MTTASPVKLSMASLNDVLARLAAGADERERAAVPAFPEEAIADLEAVGALAWNAQPGPHRPACRRRARAGPQRRPCRRLGWPDPGWPPQRRRAPGGPGTGAAARPRAGRGARRAAARRRVGRRSPPRGGDAGDGGDRGRRRGAHRGQDLLLGRRGPSPRPRPGPRSRRRRRRRPSGSTSPMRPRWPSTISWYRGAGMRASVSHRVIFDRTPRAGPLRRPGRVGEQPWFGRDALRTAASWAGMADCAVDGALDALAARPDCGPLEELATGQILTAQGTITAWLERAARAMDSASAELPEVALHARAAIAQACSHDRWPRPSARVAHTRSPPAVRWTALGAIWSCSCCSIASTPPSPPAGARALASHRSRSTP